VPSAQREHGTSRLRQPFMGATTLSGAESMWPSPRVVRMRMRNHHWKWWHPFWLSTRAPAAWAPASTELSAQREHGTTRLRQPFMGATTLSGAESTRPRPRAVPIRTQNHHFEWCGVEVHKPTRRADTHTKPPLEVVAPVLAVDSRASCSGFALGGDERAARAQNHPTATALHGCHHFEWCGIDVPKPARRADTHTKPPLEVVAPVLAVDGGRRLLGLRPRLGRARSASTEPPDCDSLFGCRLARQLLGLRPRRRRARSASTEPPDCDSLFGCRLARQLLGLRPRRRRARSASTEPPDCDSPSWVPPL
jgi:hypothetical protein